MKRRFATFVLLLCVLAAPLTDSAAENPDGATTGAKFIRVELFFGFDRRGQESVSDSEWERFLSAEVTPRFPNGFTVLSAVGQYRGEDGSIVREQSRVLMILYPKSEKRKNGALIEEIRAAYKSRFGQESVLRLEFARSVDVDF